MWDGDQILYEIRADTTNPENTAPSGAHYGIVGYTHGQGIDQPLGVFKGTAPDAFQITPLTNWRGQIDGGLCPAVRCDQTVVWFPQRVAGMYGQPYAAGGPPGWFGSLIEGQRDASGLIYQRNRYLDPTTGRFTQEDPIGFAGGLNLYGYGDGDPVSFSDPFGLCPPEDDDYGNCTPGSSEWYAGRIARGEGNRVLNELGGLGATCAESISCMATLIPETVVGAALGRVAQAVGVASKAVGNVSVKLGSVLETEVAGRLFTGRAASPIRDRATGVVNGLKNVAETKIFRQAQVKPPGHFSAGKNVANLVNKVTGGNTHLVIEHLIWW